LGDGFSRSVAVLLGVGSGDFQAARNFRLVNGSTSVVVGDFNGDGIPDLAVGHDFGNNVSVLLGDGDGDFQPPQQFGGGRRATSVGVGDFNGDGLVDLAVANYGSNDVSILINTTRSPGPIAGGPFLPSRR
jgi:hypothetical protein